MKSIFIYVAIFTVLSACNEPEAFHHQFYEDFNASTSNVFHYGSTGKKAGFSWEFGADSPSEDETKILSFKIDPEDEAGAGKGPEIISNKFTHFGRYATRLKIPDVRGLQPNIGAVVGYFTYHMDTVPGLSEIDFEWLLADPEIIYIGTWTGQRENLKRIGRTINLAKGIIYNTSYRERGSGFRETLTGEQNQPDTIAAIEGFDASSQFYTYGFDWHPEHLRWWMIHPVSADTLTLWNYHGSEVGIPQTPSYYRLNFWHTDEWSVETNPNSLEKPLQPYELEIDWMSYEPFEP